MSDSVNAQGQHIEDLSRALVVIQTEHAHLHNGEMYEASILLSEAGAIADNANADMLIQLTTPAHTIIGAACGGDAEVFVYENPTFSAAGTALTAYNKNRISSNTSSAVVTHTPTITVVGTKLFERFMPGGKAAVAQGISDGSYGHERILKGGNDYLIRVTNRAGTAQAISINLEFYELNFEL